MNRPTYLALSLSCLLAVPAVWAQSAPPQDIAPSASLLAPAASVQAPPAVPAVPAIPGALPTTEKSTPKDLSLPAAPADASSTPTTPPADLDNDTLSQAVPSSVAPDENEAAPVKKDETTLDDLAPIPSFDNTDESTLLKQAAKSQAVLDFLTIQSKIKETRYKMAEARMKYLQAKQKASADKAVAEQKMATAKAQKEQTEAAARAAAAAAKAAAERLAHPKKAVSSKPVFIPKVVTIFSFGDRHVARVIAAPGVTLSVENGDVLPNGSTVKTITRQSVIVSLPDSKKSMTLPKASASEALQGGAASAPSN